MWAEVAAANSSTLDGYRVSVCEKRSDVSICLTSVGYCMMLFSRIHKSRIRSGVQRNREQRAVTWKGTPT